jgi:hypothetical protein
MEIITVLKLKYKNNSIKRNISLGNIVIFILYMDLTNFNVLLIDLLKCSEH